MAKRREFRQYRRVVLRETERKKFPDGLTVDMGDPEMQREWHERLKAEKLGEGRGIKIGDENLVYEHELPRRSDTENPDDDGSDWTALLSRNDKLIALASIPPETGGRKDRYREAAEELMSMTAYDLELAHGVNHGSAARIQQDYRMAIQPLSDPKKMKAYQCFGQEAIDDLMDAANIELIRRMAFASSFYGLKGQVGTQHRAA